MLDDSLGCQSILAPSESIKEIDPVVVHDVGGSCIICCTAASASAQTTSLSNIEGLPLSSVPGGGTWPE